MHKEINLDFLSDLAQASSDVILPLFESKDLSVDLKADSTPVTKADRDCEEKLRTMIRKRYPDHGIIGEEFGREKEEAEYVWTIDPIDGTVSFIHGVPLFTTLIGVLRQGAPTLGLISQPVLKKLCIGTDEGTTLNGKPVHVRMTSSLNASTVVCSGLSGFSGSLPRGSTEKIREAVQTFRTWGDGWGYMMVACGMADIMIDAALHIWDAVAVIPCIHGAGGKTSSMGGGDSLKDLSLVATNGVLHDPFLKLLTQLQTGVAKS